MRTPGPLQKVDSRAGPGAGRSRLDPGLVPVSDSVLRGGGALRPGPRLPARSLFTGLDGFLVVFPETAVAALGSPLAA